MADFISCSNPAYVTMYDMVSPLREGGTFLLNCQWSVEELNERLPASMKNKLAAKKANFYIINAIDLARKVGMGGRTNTTMQAAFFKLADIIPYEDADKYMKEKVVASYGKKGEDVVKMNFAAIDAALTGLVKVDIPADWATTTEGAGSCAGRQQAARQQAGSPRYRAHRHHQVREARHRRVRARVADRQLYPVRQLRHRLPARLHPSHLC